LLEWPTSAWAQRYRSSLGIDFGLLAPTPSDPTRTMMHGPDGPFIAELPGEMALMIAS
jgi:hypothetical protein